MINRNILIIITAIFLCHFTGLSQTADPYAIIDSLRKIMDGIKDYQADLEVEVDVDFIRMPVKHACVYYRSPDKMKFRSDEFIMLPKKGLENKITQLLDEPYTAIYLRRELLNGQPYHVIRIVPTGNNPDIVVATWWINANNYLIYRNESNTRKQGEFTIDFKYGDSTLKLPTEMIFSFEIEKMNLPLKFIGKSSGMEVDKSKIRDVNEGKVYLRFSNYSVNTGIPDDFFKEGRDPGGKD